MITVFTPTYNRAYILPQLYKSLIQQTYTNFEWLLIDDGSNDTTQQLVEGWIKENRITIRYFKQHNGGKHRAINRGTEAARGELFFIVDSDDRLPPNSLALIDHYARQIEDKQDFAGVCGLKCYPDGKRVGGDFNYDILDTDPVSFREKYRIKGDMAEVWRTEILRKYPFPEFEGEKFLSEGVVWSRIAQKYKLRYFNRNIYTCDYLQDGLTRHIRRHHRQSPCGTMLLYTSIMQDPRYGFWSRLKAAVNYWRYTVTNKGRRPAGLRPPNWAYLFYPLGWYFYRKDIKSN